MFKNIPHSKVYATVFRNAYVGDIEVTQAEVTLDRNGIHATWQVGETTEKLTRLGDDYSFDAPDTLCPIKAKENYI